MSVVRIRTCELQAIGQQAIVVHRIAGVLCARPGERVPRRDAFSRPDAQRPRATVRVYHD